MWPPSHSPGWPHDTWDTVPRAAPAPKHSLRRPRSGCRAGNLSILSNSAVNSTFPIHASGQNLCGVIWLKMGRKILGFAEKQILLSPNSGHQIMVNPSYINLKYLGDKAIHPGGWVGHNMRITYNYIHVFFLLVVVQTSLRCLMLGILTQNHLLFEWLLPKKGTGIQNLLLKKEPETIDPLGDINVEQYKRESNKWT